MDQPLPLRLAARDKIAVSIKEAAQLAPFSEGYLRQAIHRTDRNHLEGRQTSDYGKYFVMVDDLTEWVKNEGNPT